MSIFTAVLANIASPKDENTLNSAILGALFGLQSVRYSQAVVAYLKSTAEGWQSRMDGVLQQYAAQHSHVV